MDVTIDTDIIYSKTAAQPLYRDRGWNAAPQATEGTEIGLYVILDIDRCNLHPPYRQ
jgi:hypothetical protein